MRMIVILAAGALLAACGAADSQDDGEAADATAVADAGDATSSARTDPADEVVADASGEVPMTISATVDGERFAAKGNGECRHAPDAYIYGVPSAMWLVQYRGDDIRSLSLTLWRPKSGDPDMVSLSLSANELSSSLSTVQQGEPAGTSTAALEMAGAGGRFVVNGQDEEGNDIALEVRCERFGAVEAVGG